MQAALHDDNGVRNWESLMLSTKMDWETDRRHHAISRLQQQRAALERQPQKDKEWCEAFAHTSLQVGTTKSPNDCVIKSPNDCVIKSPNDCVIKSPNDCVIKLPNGRDQIAELS